MTLAGRAVAAAGDGVGAGVALAGRGDSADLTDGDGVTEDAGPEQATVARAITSTILMLGSYVRMCRAPLAHPGLKPSPCAF